MEMSVCWKAARSIAARDDLPWDDLDGRAFLVTGATGLIGSQLVRTLLARKEATASGLRVVAPVRDEARAARLFVGHEGVELARWNAGESLPEDVRADYVVHAASPTSSADFVRRPIEVIESVVDGAKEALRCAERCGSRRVLLLSTMEVYGEVAGTITEDAGGSLDTMSPRSSYPEAKRLAECLFASHAVERGTHATVARLAQTFGEGVAPGDGRVFAEFLRCAMGGQDIVLLSDGSKRNQYLSVDDAVRAVLVLLSRGEDGRAYNVANPGTFCSIREMADLVARELGGGRCRVTFGSNPERAVTFRRGSTIDLDVSRLEALGWQPEQTLPEMYRAMVACWGDGRG